MAQCLAMTMNITPKIIVVTSALDVVTAELLMLLIFLTVSRQEHCTPKEVYMKCVIWFLQLLKSKNRMFIKIKSRNHQDKSI